METKTLFRNSRQRSRILELLKSTTAHPTAQEIYDYIREDFPNLSLGTVYRNLNILVEQGEIMRLQNGSTFDRYDGITSSHYHFICTACSRVYDMPIEPFSDIEKIADQQSNHSIRSHRVDFYGVCESCRKKHREAESIDSTPRS